MGFLRLRSRSGILMDSIIFSKEYIKLHGQTKAELLSVRRIRIDEKTPDELIEYDTTAIDGSRYELKKGDYIQLVFIGNLGIPFCTIRTNNPSLDGRKAKYEFYSERIGHTFILARG